MLSEREQSRRRFRRAYDSFCKNYSAEEREEITLRNIAFITDTRYDPPGQTSVPSERIRPMLLVYRGNS